MGIFCVAICMHAVDVDELIPESESLLQTESAKDLMIRKLQAKLAASNAKNIKLGMRLRSMARKKQSTVKSDFVESDARLGPPAFSLFGKAQFWIPSASGASVSISSSSERDVKMQLMQKKQAAVLKRKSKLTPELQLPDPSLGGASTSSYTPPDSTSSASTSSASTSSPSTSSASTSSPSTSSNAADLDPWATGTYPFPTNGPITDTSSVCRQFWNTPDGPGKIGRRAAGTLLKDVLNQFMVKRTDSSGPWSVGSKIGCSNIQYSATEDCGPSSGVSCNQQTRVCGCYETWCPVKNLVLAAADDSRKKCFTLRRYFGCFRKRGDGEEKWVEKCFQDQANVLRGRGPFWELSMF